MVKFNKVILCGISIALLGGCVSTAANFQKRSTSTDAVKRMALTPSNGWERGGKDGANETHPTLVEDPLASGNGYTLYIDRKGDNQFHRKDVHLQLLKTYKAEFSATTDEDCRIRSYLNPNGNLYGSWEQVTNNQYTYLHRGQLQSFEVCYKVKRKPVDNLWFTFNLGECLTGTKIVIKDMTFNEVNESECPVDFMFTR